MADLWRPPRDCNDYWDEWKLCTSLRHRFHYYYTYGGKPDCQQWKADYTACNEWEKTRKQAAKEALLQSERARVKERQNSNPVWEMRTRPPADWYLPLDNKTPQDDEL